MGHLGEVTFRGGIVTSPNPPNSQSLPSLPTSKPGPKNKDQTAPKTQKMAPKSTAPKNWKQKELSSFLQKDGGTDKLTSTPKYIDEEQTTSLERLPSSGENLEPEDEKGLLCKNDKRGRCVIHGCTMRKSSVNTRKWGAKGDNNFGWIYKKVTKYSCQAKINARLSLAKKS